mmetsp:Transcript_3733/g.4070  ORF Transcript_3733/g.4070 Transcript_3733/m.4070 type:complete len:96 (+) Transcript_3733:257-544(+)
MDRTIKIICWERIMRSKYCYKQKHGQRSKAKKGKQSRQFFENVVGENTYVMLPTCLALMKDPEMTSAINAYANSQNLLSKDLASAYNKLLSLSLA